MTKFTAEEEKDLNNLVNRNGINNPQKGISLVKMVNNHDISKESEVEEMMREHQDGGCDDVNCDLVCNKNLNELSEELYDLQKEKLGEYKYSREMCYSYLYDLFTRRVLNGVAYEQKAKDDIEDAYDVEIQVRKANEVLDEEYNVDLVVSKNDIDVCGIQVKPKSYDNKKDILLKTKNNIKNNKYGLSVYYLTYDDDGWVNLDDVVDKIDEEIIDLMV